MTSGGNYGETGSVSLKRTTIREAFLMGFLVFLLVNATLFIRPGEVIPELTEWPIYNYMILANLLVACCISMMSLSRTYALPSYLIAGMIAVYVGHARPLTSLPPQYLSNKLIVLLFAGSIGFLGFIYLYIKLLIRMG